MSKILVKCPECGDVTFANAEKEAAICSKCGEPFLVAKAVRIEVDETVKTAVAPRVGVERPLPSEQIHNRIVPKDTLSTTFQSDGTLIEYLEEVARCEQSLYSLRQLKSGLTERLNALHEPAKPIEPVFKFSSVKSYFSWLGILYIPTAIILMLALATGGDNPGGAIVGIAAFVAPAIIASYRKKHARNEYVYQLAEHKAALADYEKEYALFPKKKSTLEQEIETADDCIRATEDILRKLYDVGVIFPKYRELIAVSMFLEYIQSKRCDTLDGQNGAYNLYESELRMNRIIGQLDVVVIKLDEIRDAQYMVYEAVRESNRLAEASLRELSSIGRSATAAALYAEQTAKNNSILVELNRDKYNRLVTKGGRVLNA